MKNTHSSRMSRSAEPGKQELVMVQEFDAPRELVFKAFIDPELQAQWMGPRELTTESVRFEPKAGESWRFIQRDAAGNRYGFHGVFHEVTPLERIIQTWEYEELPEPGHTSLERVDFEELPGGRTRVVSKVVYLTLEDRDGLIQSGMEGGMNDSYERLCELFVRIQG